MIHKKLQYFEKNFDEPRGGRFRKYCVEYSSQDYMLGKIFYSTKDGYHCERFLLEPGENVSFESYIDGYPEGKYAWDFYRVEFRAIKKENAEFQLHNVKAVKATAWHEEVFAENEKMKIGANLRWGGAICLVQDKLSIDELPNLLNVSSPRNMLYKSYLGTSGYTDGDYAYVRGEIWPYNPVQIGDQFGNPAKLVDFKVTKKSIYVKSRPMDWAKSNKLVQGYIEATYTLLDDCLRADTKFIDFSENNTSHTLQIWPEMHVLSYLDCFHYYNGKKPWQGDPITSRRNPGPLIEENVRKSLICLHDDNRECWCAWTADTDGFGIGIYSPGIHMLTAWQEDYDASYDEFSESNNVVTLEKMFRWDTFRPVEHTFFIATGQVETIREIFTAHCNDVEESELDENDYYDDTVEDSQPIMVWQEDEVLTIEDLENFDWRDYKPGGPGGYYTYEG